MNKLIVSAMAFVLLNCATPARAQFAVIDPANLVQNILTAVRTLETVNNQIRQLQNEAVVLSNMQRNLQGLDFNALRRLRTTLATTQRLFQEARGLAFQLARAQEEFARLYPAAYDDSISHEQLNADRKARWDNSRNALDTTVQMQAQARENFAEDEAVLADLVTRSQSAVGALQAAQSTNQLLALQTRQLMQGQQLQIAQDRAAALEQARAVAAEERARELRRRFMSRETRYTPEPVELFE
jgi:P-type conjugative transfer protein TrbJ